VIVCCVVLGVFLWFSVLLFLVVVVVVVVMVVGVAGHSWFSSAICYEENVHARQMSEKAFPN
jgi:hypothetical protein